MFLQGHYRYNSSDTQVLKNYFGAKYKITSKAGISNQYSGVYFIQGEDDCSNVI